MSDSLDGEIRSLRAQYWSPRDPEGRAFAPLAEAYRRSGELAEAHALVRDGLGRLPDYAPGHLVASRVARDRGEFLAAREHLDRVLDLDPHNASALLERGALRREEGDSEGAILDLRALLELEPEHPEARAALSRIETEGEVGVLTVGTGEEPLFGNVLPPEELAAIEVDGDAAGEEEEEDGAFLLTRTMGDLFAKQGLYAQAIEVYEQLLAVNPADVDLGRRLDELRAEEESGGGGGARAVPAPTATEIEGEPSSGRGAAPGERTIHRYIGDLLAWVPGAVPIATLAPDPVEAPSTVDPASERDTPSMGVGSDMEGNDPPDDDLQDWIRSLRE